MSFHLAVGLVTGIAWLYLAWRFACLLPGRRWLAGGVAVALLLIGEYHLVAHGWFGDGATVELPRPVMIALAWAFGGFVLLLVLTLLRDMVGCVARWPSRRLAHVIWRDARLNSAIGILAAVLAAWGVWQAVRVPAVKTVNVTLAGLPSVFDGYRVAQLTDIHASPLLPGSWVAAVVARTQSLKPDLIVITGDLADGSPAARAADVAPLRALHAPDGVLAVPGNHEYYSDYAGWMKSLRALGLHMLLNTHVLIEHDGRHMAVAGITDHQARAFGDPPPDIAKALDGIPRGTPVILLSHHPGNAPRAARDGVALELAGHTHGGQVLGLGLLTKWANNGFVSGRYRVGPMTLYVSNGTGLWSGYAIRLGRRSEITQIVLHAPRQSKHLNASATTPAD